MTHSAFGRTVATIALTLVFSGTAILSAIGPAQASAPANATSPTTQRVA